MSREMLRSSRVIISDDGVITLASGRACLVDPQDVAFVRQYRITEKRRRDGRPVIYCHADDNAEPLHRAILQVKRSAVVDHRNGDTLDNRRRNLRVCALQQNNQNLALSRRNTTGFKGVGRRGDGYRAYGTADGVHKHIGMFETAAAAARAYDRFAREHFGEFACLNFPNPGEQSVHRGRANK